MKTSILVVDGNHAYRGKVAGSLRAAGFDTLEAEDLGAAAAQFGKADIKTAVVESGRDGSGAAAAIEMLRKLAPRAKLVLVSGGDENPATLPDDRQRLIVRGPVHPDALAAKVTAWLCGADPLPSAEPAALPVEHRSNHPPRRASLPPRLAPRGEDTDSRLRDLRDSYRRGLPVEFDRLESMARSARDRPGDREPLREIHRLAHSIHGTAGTMGFAEVSSAAGDIEREVGRGLADGHPFAVNWEAVFEAIDRARAAPPPRPSRHPEEPLRVAGMFNVLVVDDDPGMLAAFESMARKNMVEAVSARDSEDALRLARGRHLDGALIDIYLEGGDSPFEVAEALRSLEGHEDLPIAFISVDGSVPNRVAAVAAGASSFIEKPLTAQDLMETVRGFVAAREHFVPRVLIVDDDDAFREHTAALLDGEQMKVTTLGDPGRVLEVLDEVQPDLLLLDVMMPGIDGFDVCRMLRASSPWRELPILFLTGEQSPTARVECFLAGGDDYIPKPALREELMARIGVRVERARLFRERADRDVLTGLHNRRAFLELFRLRMADAARDGRPLSLCLLDLDEFKLINDRRGHLSGDRVLAGLGRLLGSRFRSTDIRCRWGGEEFALAFLGEERETAQMILGRVLDEFTRMVFDDDRGQGFSCTFSAGVATFPEDGETFEDLLRAADRNLYRAKDEGRNRVL